VEKILLWIKNLLSGFLYHSHLCTLINCCIKRYYGGLPIVNVLCYHSVQEHQGPSFKRQLDYLLENNYRFLSGSDLDAMIASPSSFQSREKYICLTFDDCYEDNYYLVRPILAKKKIPAIFFAVSSKLGKLVDWTDNAAKTSLMTPEQLKEMALFFDIGSHTRSHVRLARLDSGEALIEVKESKDELMAILKRPVVLFAYPNGSFNREIVRVVEECGFKAAFTIEQHQNYDYSEKLLFGRYIINPDNFRDFKVKVAGGFDWVYFLRKLLRWLFGDNKPKNYLHMASER
jgi:peptidoglycan/xylan/chitin deacetylase (PgdA/CDA1 family)